MTTDPLIEVLDSIHDRLGEVRKAVNDERAVREAEDSSLRELFEGKARNFAVAVVALVFAVGVSIGGFVYVNAETNHRCQQIHHVVDAETSILNKIDQPGASPQAHDFVVQADATLAQAREC